MNKSVFLLPDNPPTPRTLGCRLTTCFLPRPVCGTLTLETLDFPRLVSILSHLMLHSFFFFLTSAQFSFIHPLLTKSEVYISMWR